MNFVNEVLLLPIAFRMYIPDSKLLTFKELLVVSNFLTNTNFPDKLYTSAVEF
jgi:hypothetical protein